MQSPHKMTDSVWHRKHMVHISVSSQSLQSWEVILYKTIGPSAIGVEQIINAKEIRGVIRVGSMKEVRLEFGHRRTGRI